MAYIPPNPNGSATSANSSPVVIASDQSAVPVSAASLPLPAGAATGTKQDTGNTSVASIDTKTPALGQALAASSVPVTLTALEEGLIGALIETAPATDTASSGLNGRLQRVAQRITSLIALLPTALGAGGGLKIDGSGTALPISGTVTANAGTNLNTSALALDATLSTTNTEIGIVTETAPATDTASSGLNGRLQRVAQRLTSLIGLLPTALGQGTMATSLKVVLPSDQSAIPVSGTVSITANSAVNVAQVNGITVLTGTGATGTGSQRVTVAVDSATVGGSASLPTGTNVIGALTANQSVNNAQVNGVTTQTGVGASGTGTQRVVTSTDSTIGTVTAVTSITNTVTAQGAKTNNNSSPGANNLGVLPAIANAAIQTWIEGALVAASVDLSGNTRVIQPDAVVTATAITTTNLNLNSGAATANSTVASLTLQAADTGAFQVTGTYNGTLVPQGTVDGANWVTLTTIQSINSSTTLSALSSGQVGIFQVDVSGFTKWRVTASSFSSGTATVTLETTVASGLVTVGNKVLLDPSTAPTVVSRNGNSEAFVNNPSETLILEAIRDQNQVILDALGIVGGNANAIRQVDFAGRERITAPADTFTYNVVLNSSTTETVLIPGIPGSKTILVGLVITNTSTSASSRVDIRDSTATTDAAGVQPFQAVGGAPPAGFMGGGMIRIPQRVAGRDWTVQCASVVSDIRVTAYYQII